MGAQRYLQLSKVTGVVRVIPRASDVLHVNTELCFGLNCFYCLDSAKQYNTSKHFLKIPKSVSRFSLEASIGNSP